jgi:integrase/recombinase XerD
VLIREPVKTMRRRATKTALNEARKVYLEPEDAALLEGAATNLRDRLLERLLFRTGCRISEALALKVDDIDFARGTVTIQHLKSRVRLSCPRCEARLGRSHVFCPGCGEKVGLASVKQLQHRRLRTLPLDKDTMELLRTYIRQGGPTARHGEMLVFGINRHRAWQIVKECAEKAGLPKLINPETGRVHNVSPHKLRDAFAVHAVKLNDSGDGLRLLQEHLGHTSFDTTARYRKVAGEELRGWYDRLWSQETNGDGSQTS